jgi:hypothetical protein
MKPTEARIAFVNARELHRIASLELARSEKRLDVLRKRELSQVWASLAHDEWKAARAEEAKRFQELEEAEQMLAVVEELHSLDLVHDLNVRFERWSAKVSRFFARDL